MSKWDRVNVRALAACCIAAIQRRPGLGAEGDVIGCAACGALAVFARGVWSVQLAGERKALAGAARRRGGDE